MSYVTQPTALGVNPGRRPGKLLHQFLMIAAPVLFLMIGELVLNRLNRHEYGWDWDIREISLLDIREISLLRDIVLLPISCIIVQEFLSWARRRRAVFFASPDFAGRWDGENASRWDEEHAARRDRERVRAVAAGLAIGLFLGLGGLVLDLAWKGWRIFADPAVFVPLAFPWVGAFIATVGTWLPGDPILPWRRARISVLALVFVVAQLALIHGLVVRTRALGFRALSIHVKWRGATRSAARYRAQIRDFKIDHGLPLEYYQDELFYAQEAAEKYRKAAQHPWDPEEPDPPWGNTPHRRTPWPPHPDR